MVDVSSPSFRHFRLGMLGLGALVILTLAARDFSVFRTSLFEAPQEGQASSAATTAEEVIDRCHAQTDPAECLKQEILDSTERNGPESAMVLFRDILAKEELPGDSDYHDFVHRIGRRTAKTFGVNTPAFLRCPLDFNYGCPHGFFEQALAQNPNPKEVAETICRREAMRGMPRKSYFYCFHGVGHGFMMAKAYRLQASLDLCDSLSDSEAQDGCWQGVFMENVVGRMERKNRLENFSEDDLLAPCNSLDSKYERECYINHAGYLMEQTGNSIARSASACLKASAEGKKVCLQSLGLLATNPGWQKAIAPDAVGTLPEVAHFICQQFPDTERETCFDAAVDNLGNNERTDLRHALEFCSLAPTLSKNRCYRSIGVALRRELPISDDGSSVCGQVPEPFRERCMDGMKA